MVKDSKNSFIERLIKGGLVVFLLNSLAALVSYVIRAFYSHTLSVEMFGLFYAGLNFFGLFWTYSDLGFGYAVTYLMPKYMKSLDYKTTWNVFRYGQFLQVGISFLFSIVLFYLTPKLALLYFKVPGSESFLYILCLFLVMNTLLSSLIQFFMGVQVEKYYSLITFVRAVSIFIISVVFWSFKHSSIQYYAWSWVVGYALTALVFIYLMHRKYKHITNNNLKWDKNIIKKMSDYAFPMFLTTIVYSLLSFSDTFLLTLFRGVSEVGVYNIIYPLASVSLILFTPFNNLLQPMYSHLMEGEKEKALFLTNKLFELVPFLGVYFALFLILFPVTPIKLFFGDKWLGVTNGLLGLLSFAAVFSSTAYIMGSIILGIGKVKERFKIILFVVIFSVTTNIILISNYGVLGVVITNLLVSVISVILLGKIIYNVIKYKIPYLLYIKLTFSSFLMYLLVRTVKYMPSGWVEYFIAGIAYTLLLVVMGYMFGVYNRRLINILFSMFQKRFEGIYNKTNSQ